MPNVRLPESRQRFGSALIVAASAIVVVGWIPLAIWANVQPLVTMAIGMLFFVVGVLIVTIKVVCPNCGRRHWIAGRPTRLNCASCGAAYFEESPGTEKAG